MRPAWSFCHPARTDLALMLADHRRRRPSACSLFDRAASSAGHYEAAFPRQSRFTLSFGFAPAHIQIPQGSASAPLRVPLQQATQTSRREVRSRSLFAFETVSDLI